MKTVAKTLISTAFAGALATAAASASAASVTTVTAEPPRDSVSVTVSFEDLDLTSEKGQETLYYRLSRAAETVCGSANVRETGNLGHAARNADCQDAALSRALSEVNASAVASTH